METTYYIMTYEGIIQTQEDIKQGSLVNMQKIEFVFMKHLYTVLSSTRDFKLGSKLLFEHLVRLVRLLVFQI